MQSLNRAHFLTFCVVILMAGTAWSLSSIEDHQDIEGPFADGPSVTATCLECHEDEAHDFMKTSHWTWMPDQNVIGKGEIALGKRNTINNFCIAVDSNWPRCTSCHAGFGWKDATFDFTVPENIDCLVCHDQTGLYRKFPTGAGHPAYENREWKGKIWEPLDLAGIARSVGQSSRKTCGACHFYGGGGNNVKHGDLDESLIKPALELDVHMSGDGNDFNCTECHTTSAHQIAGDAMFDSPGGRHNLECTSCHDDDVHAKRILNWHGKSIACQTCHIPSFARVFPTKVWWDWSTAGTDVENVKDENGKDTYDKKKGSFKWAKNVVPTYVWYNGTSTQYLIGDTMTPEQVIHLNKPQGNRLDPKAKIYPFKVMRGKQPYDIKNRTLAVPKLFGKGGFWKNGFEWDGALAQGMKAAGLEYSGQYGFAETEGWWKINHMVAPASMALKCKQCHDVDNASRMNWQALGYEKDPSKVRGLSRFELKDAYQDVNQD
jgi:octaheme c-type cytochrome (tetrathionate reductase family)